MQNLILNPELYRGVYEKIYYVSASATLDRNLRPICEYAEQVLKQDPDTDPCLISGWDEERLRKIIAKQKAAVAKAKRMNLKKPLPQILMRHRRSG